MDIKKYFKTKEVKILIISAMLYATLQCLIKGAIELDTIIVYGLIALILGNVIKIKKMKIIHYAIFLFFIPIIYNILLSSLGFFSYSFEIVKDFLISIQQTITGIIVAKLFGGSD